MAKYDDILHLSRPESHRTPMTRENRAVQFAPFAALTGFEEAVVETARQTDVFMVPDEYTTEKINQALFAIQEKPTMGQSMVVTYFVPDQAKDGGTHKTCTGIRKVLPAEQCLKMCDGTTVPFSYIVKIEANEPIVLP